MSETEMNDLARIEEDILDNGSSYSFQQVVRLLRGRAGRNGAAGEGANTRLRVRPHLSLELPRSEVVKVERRDDGYDLVATFLGLYGASSPLPAFYTEELIEAAQEDRTTAQALIDVIHQHLFELYIAAREKQRTLDAVVERGDTRFQDAVRSLIGLRDDDVRRTLPDPDRMLRYIPLLGARQRSAEGLETLLADALGDTVVAVDQCVERRVRIPAPSRMLLGQQSHSLGENAVIGSYVRDRLGRFRVRIGPMDERRFFTLVNQSTHWKWLVRLIRFYVNTSAQCELEILLEEGAGGTTVLGDSAMNQLGTTTWLFSGKPGGIRANLQIDQEPGRA